MVTHPHDVRSTNTNKSERGDFRRMRRVHFVVAGDDSNGSEGKSVIMFVIYHSSKTVNRSGSFRPWMILAITLWNGDIHNADLYIVTVLILKQECNSALIKPTSDIRVYSIMP